MRRALSVVGILLLAAGPVACGATRATRNYSKKPRASIIALYPVGASCNYVAPDHIHAEESDDVQFMVVNLCANTQTVALKWEKSNPSNAAPATAVPPGVGNAVTLTVTIQSGTANSSYPYHFDVNHAAAGPDPDIIVDPAP